MFCQLLAFACVLGTCLVSAGAEPEHVAVFQEEGKFGGWPANGGMWAWGDEILLCYTEADHQDRRGHTYDQSTARNMFARSLDGGETWIRENAYAQGITMSLPGHGLLISQHSNLTGVPSKPAEPTTSSAAPWASR